MLVSYILAVIVLSNSLTWGRLRQGEFIAGSFILTQKSLNEAPYRYAGILRKALDRVETKDPPAQSDEENCDVRYRILPSGRKSKLRIIEDTLAIQLRENNTVIIAAKVYVEVAAKTWIWKGISFGFLGCLKMNSCNGQIVTYSSNVDFQISFQVFWNEAEERLSITIKPVHTVLKDVNVAGCKPPWYLWWFKKWQSLLNQGVQEAFQEFANNYEHQSQVPEEFSPFPDVFIQYAITNLIWSKDQVIFQASASFKTLVDGKNVTFTPLIDASEAAKSIPIDKWPMKSPDDLKSHLLQGVRLTTEFLNSLMWYADIKNITQYNGHAKVLDSLVNGTISYDPPRIFVEEDHLLSIHIRHGLLHAVCKPVVNETAEPSTLFKAEFYDLAGSGKIDLASTKDQTGIQVNLDKLDLSRMNTKPFEPKLPLPESFENELMKNAIAQLQPVINNYLESKPLYLPDNVAPFAASPKLSLWSTGKGSGYAEVLSYCTCNSIKTASNLATCDARSHICDGKTIEIKAPESDEQSDDSGFSISDIVKKGFKNVASIAHGILKKEKEEKSDDFNFFQPSTSSSGGFNFTALLEESKKNLSYNGGYLTFYENNESCVLTDIGSTAKVFWLWNTGRCTPLFLYGKEINQYYWLDNHMLKFGCSDDACKFCEYQNISISLGDNSCLSTFQSQSLRLDLSAPPDILSWRSTNISSKSLIANIFYSQDFCQFHPRYVEPQLLSSHVNLGTSSENNGTCVETIQGSTINLIVSNDSVVKRANWDCSRNCFGCLFRVRDVPMENCFNFKEGINVLFSETVFKADDDDDLVDSLGKTLSKAIPLKFVLLYVSIIGGVIFGALIITATIFWKRKSRKHKEDIHLNQNSTLTEKISFKQHAELASLKAKTLLQSHFGLRFKTWNKYDIKGIRDDVLQNLMITINGILAIVFAFEWNSDNNPLLIIQNKFKRGITISVDIFNMDKMTSFTEKLNQLTLIVNVMNAVVAFLIVLGWILTRTGSRHSWTKIRLLSSVSMLAGIFCVVAATIFSTFFEDLVLLERNKGFIITDNDSMYSMANKVIKVSLNGLSLTVVSFTLVFLFHAVGGGLYCGTVVFRILHLHSKKSNLEILTTLVVILTIIQPFICLHPVIIWSQDSNHNSKFLLLIILIWFLPLLVHVGVKSLLAHCRPICQSKIEPKASTTKQKNTIMTFVDLFVQIMQLVFFLTSFGLITHYIVHTEFNQDRSNLQDFVLPAIVSVFFWMMSISYLLLSLVLDETRKETRLVFKDQNFETARAMLRSSLKRRLATLDNRIPERRALHSQINRNPSQDEGVDLANSLTSNRPSTLPAFGVASGMNAFQLNDLSDSMRGRKILMEDLQRVQVGSKEDSDTEICPDENTRAQKYLKDDDTRTEVEAKEVSQTCWSRAKRLYHFLLESKEYRDPLTFGWRIKFRRIFLSTGVILFTYLTSYTTWTTQDFSSKEEIQTLLDYAGTNLTWPDSGSVLDDVFGLYNTMQRTKSYIMIGASLLFWSSLILDFASHFALKESRKSLCFTGSRVTNFMGSLAVFAGVIIVGLPDYLEASHLDEICPFCGTDFNATVRQVAEFSIGLFFACLFTFQLFPILITIVPALVRASVLILIHPFLNIDADDDVVTLRMTILQQVIQFSSFLTFPITFISMAIVQQYQKDIYVTLLIIAFWTFPPLVLYLGLHYSRKFRRYTILLYVYYLYNFCYFAILISLLFYSLTMKKILELLENMMQEPTFWAGSIAQIFLCNVVISDMLYMTVF